MTDINRRSALALGLAATAATPLLISADPAVAKEYGPNDGKELAPGVRIVELGTFKSDIPAYKSINLVDIVFQPGAVVPETMRRRDVCLRQRPDGHGDKHQHGSWDSYDRHSGPCLKEHSFSPAGLSGECYRSSVQPEWPSLPLLTQLLGLTS